MPSSSPAESDLGRPEQAAEAKAAFHLRMRAQGIRDLRVLRAFELVPRAYFVPSRHESLAARDLAIPIDCGQTLNEPGLVARMIEALAVEPGHRVLEIGAGTGYATAILAQLGDEVIGIERFQSLATAAGARLDALGIANAAIVWGDGLSLPADVAPFDRILVHGILEEPADLLRRLTPGGVLVCAAIRDGAQAIARSTRGLDGHVTETSAGSCRLQPLVPGLAAAL